MTPEQQRLIEAARAANPIQPLGQEDTYDMLTPPRKRSDFYRGGKNDLLGGHDPALLTPPKL